MKFIGAHIFDYDATFRGDVTIEGNLTISNSVSQTISFGDNDKLKFGDGNDLEIYHDGSNSYIDAVDGSPGYLYIRNTKTDGDIYFQSDDGAGGVAHYFFLDGSIASHDGSATTALYTTWPDKSRLTLGSSRDMQLYHDGTSSYIQNQTGNLTFRNFADDTDIIFETDDGSGGYTPYITLDGSATRTIFSQEGRFNDNVNLKLGSGGDASLVHTGSHFQIRNSTGDISIVNNTDDGDITLGTDDGSGGTTTYITLDGSETRTNAHKEIRFDDDVAMRAGAGGDLRIKHDGTDSLVDNFTGHLYVRQNVTDKDIFFMADDGSGSATTYFFLDGSATQTKFNRDTRHIDNIKVLVGSDGDAAWWHDGTRSRLDNYTGNLEITNYANDSDIVFKSDDGSGGTETYFYLDGSASSGDPYTVWPDNSIAAWGTGVDLRIQHDGSTASIFNTTGHLQIINYADDKDIIFKSDDGSGGVETYFYLDGSLSSGNPFTKFPDNSILVFGDGNDMRFYHDGTNSNIINYTGNLNITNNTDDGDIIFSTDDGSGGTTEYFRLDGGDVRTIASKPFRLVDSIAAEFGTGLDMQIYHSGGEGTLENITGNLRIIQNADDADIEFKCDDGSGGNTTYFLLDGSRADGTFKYIEFPDNSIIGLGNDTDAQMYHNGTNSIIDNYTGNFIIQQKADDKDIIFSCDDGSGGVTAYITLDGSATTVEVAKATNFAGNVTVNSSGSIYNSANFTVNGSIYSSGNIEVGTSSTYVGKMFNSAGKLTFQSDGDRDIQVGSSNNANIIAIDTSALLTTFSGPVTVGVDDTGHDVKFFGATSGKYLLWDESDNALEFTDSTYLYLGSSADLKLYHDGSSTYMENNTGNFNIMSRADDADLVFWGDDGSGGDAAYLTIDGSATTVNFGKSTFQGDNVYSYIGNNYDLRIHHDGTDTFFHNDTGDLKFQQDANDKDIIFQADDGSGGLAKYLTLDGSAGYTVADKAIRFNDSVTARFGTGSDFTIQHDGNDTYLNNNTGNFVFFNLADDKDIVFKTDNGSGGTTDYIRLDGSAEQTIFSQNTLHSDSVEARFGTGSDLKIHHDGSNSYVRNFTGDLYIRNTVDDKDIILESDDGSGGTTAYITLDGSETEIHLHKPVGIGTTNPDTAYKLDVAGKAQVQSVLELDDVLTLNAISTPADPATNKSSIYMDSADGSIKVKINVGGTTVTRTLATFE